MTKNKSNDSFDIFPLSQEAVFVESEEILTHKELIVKALEKVLKDRDLDLPLGPQLDLYNPDRTIILNKFEVQIVSSGILSDEVKIRKDFWKSKIRSPQLVLAALIDEDNNIVYFKGMLTGSELKNLVKNENFNQDTFVVKTKKFKGGIDRLLRSVRILNTEAVERVEINKGKLLDFKVINKNFKRTITVGAALAGTILFGPELLKPRLMGGIALLETNQISTFSNSTTRGINKSIKSSICLLSPSEINKDAIIPSAEISIDKPLLFSLNELKEISILKNGQEVWNSNLKTTNLISKPLNWPIAPIRPNDNYVVALTPGEDTSKEPTYLELKQKIKPLFEIDSLEERLGKNKKLWEKEISKNLKDNQDLALSLLYSENIPDSKRFNEVREKIRESVKCP